MQHGYIIHKVFLYKTTLVASPLPFLKKMSPPFRYPLSNQKETDAFPESLESYLSLYCLLGARSHSHGNAPLRVSRLHEGRYTPKHQRACLCPSLPHLWPSSVNATQPVLFLRVQERLKEVPGLQTDRSRFLRNP